MLVYLQRNQERLINYYAEVAQLVEHDLAKVGVASSSLVFCSAFNDLKSYLKRWLFLFEFKRFLKFLLIFATSYSAP